MSKELEFAKIIEALLKLAKEQGNCISKEQIQEHIKELDFSDEQVELIYDFLKEKKIGIGEPVDPFEYMTDEEKDYIREYMEELNAIEQYEAGKFEAITLSAMAGDSSAKEELINQFLLKVCEVSQLYVGQGVTLEDLIGEGNLSLTMSVNMLNAFENAREAQAAIVSGMMDAMEALIDEVDENHKKDRKVEDKVNRVADLARELAKELGRKVTVDELKQESGLSEKAIRDAIRMSGDKIEDIEGTTDGKNS